MNIMYYEVINSFNTVIISHNGDEISLYCPKVIPTFTLDCYHKILLHLSSLNLLQICINLTN